MDGAGKPNRYVAYWGYWVEGGVISDEVASGLRSAIPGTLPQVNDLVRRAVANANMGGPYSYAYYLPGRSLVGGNVLQALSKAMHVTLHIAGNVSDDVTIVAVRR